MNDTHGKFKPNSVFYFGGPLLSYMPARHTFLFIRVDLVLFEKNLACASQ